MDKDLGKITDAILRSYKECGGINHVDGANLPSKRALASICEDLLQLLFPGFHDQEPIRSSHLARVTVYRVTAIADRLRDEVCKSLRLTEPECPVAKAERILFEFLERLPDVRSLLTTDVQAAFDGDPAAARTDE